MSAQRAALQNIDILAEIVDQLAPALRQHVANLALVSQAFHIPATKTLWSELPSMRPLLLLLPEFDRLYPGPRTEKRYAPEYKIRLSEPVSPESWARFRERAAFVRIIHADDKPWLDGHLSEQSWSHLARLLGRHESLFPSLRTVDVWRPTATGDDLRLLTSSSLQSFCILNTRIGSGENEGRCALAIQDMFIRAPALTAFEAISSENLFSHISPEALVNLKTLRYHVDLAADLAPNTWYPNAASLQVLAALPALEYLQVELGRGYRQSTIRFSGFSSLTELDVTDCGNGDVTWLLARCSSPRLRKLTIDVANMPVNFQWTHMRPLLSNIAQGAPHLQSLVVSFRRFNYPPTRHPDMLLAVAHPLLALRHLTTLTLWFLYGEMVLSDAVLESFAEAWPELVSFYVCFQVLPPAATDMLGSDPATVTLRSLRSFSRHCPRLKHLHIPHLYASLGDCSDDAGEQAHADHRLSRLVVCRAVIEDVHGCGEALCRLFPHLDVDGSRELFQQAHNECSDKEIRPYATAWSSTLDAVAGPKPPNTDTN